MPGILKRTPDQDSQNSRSQKRAKYAGPAFDAIPTEIDPLWIDDEEHATPSKKPRSGPAPNLLVRALTKPCHPASDASLRSDNAYYRCIASSVCAWTLKAWDRSLPRIYKHAVQCRALRSWKPVLFQQAESALASLAPGGLGEPETSSQEQSTPAILGNSHQLPLVNPFSRYDRLGSMSLQDQLDHALAALICASGSPARLIDYPEWTRYSRLLNPNYTPPKSNYIRDRLVPAEARRAVLHMREYLQGETNISLSFDGLTAGHQPIYTLHVCTPDRRTFLYRADIFYGSHNAIYIQDFLEQASSRHLIVIKEIGVHRIASIVSDDTATTKKARRDASKKYSWILNLADPVHKFNLCIQDICRDPIWDGSLKQLRKLLTHFKMSSYATGRLNDARRIEGILRSLQSIGNTRFATIYYAATSVLDNLPALYRIYRNKEIDTKGTPLPSIVAEALDETSVTALKFRQDLKELVNILEPFARALLCLESTLSTLSDVYFFWLGALAALNHHFKSRNCLLLPDERARIRRIASKRFNEAINDAPTDAYVTAFFLDPRFRNFAIYAASNASSHGLASPALAHSHPVSAPQRLNEQIFERVRKQLFAMLKAELEVAEDISSHPLHSFSEDALVAKELLREQLDRYSWADHQSHSSHLLLNQSPLQYWRSQKQFEHVFLLAYLAEKMFSVLPNSMCDERAGSRLTHLYSKLRTRLDANSMIDQIQFMQWESLVDGSYSKKQGKKLPSLFRFSDLPNDFMPEHQAAGETAEIGPALGDECGDEWLNTSESEPLPVNNGDDNQASTRSEDLIDLTSQELLALFTTHDPSAQTVGLELPLVKSAENSEELGMESEGPKRVIRRARDINWD